MNHAPHYLIVTAGKRQLAETTRRVDEFCAKTGWHGLVLPFGAASVTFPCQQPGSTDAIGFRQHVAGSEEDDDAEE